MTLLSRPTATLLGLSLAALALTACGSDSDNAAASDNSNGDGAGVCDPADVKLVGQVRNESNPYEAAWLAGGDEFAASVGLEQQRLTYDGESTKQQEQIRQILASGDTECMVLNVLPNGDSDTEPIVRAADQADAFLVTQWNKPGDLEVSDFDRWLTHLTYDGNDSGGQIAEALFEEMGGSGGIIALQGILDTGAAQDRFAGLQAALEGSDVELLDEQTANFSRAEALDVTKTLLTKHGDAIKGIWAANDDMALGALEALEQAGRTDVAVAGIDAVPEAIEAINAGTLTATVSSDGPWQGGIGLAIGYCVATGEIDVDDIDPRAWFANQTLITADNAADFLTPSTDPADFECGNVFDRVAGPLS